MTSVSVQVADLEPRLMLSAISKLSTDVNAVDSGADTGTVNSAVAGDTLFLGGATDNGRELGKSDSAEAEEVSAPTVLTPTGVTDGRGLHFSWTAIPEALGYEVWLAPDGSPANPVLNVFRTQTTLDPDLTLPIGRYRLWVRAELAVGFSN